MSQDEPLQAIEHRLLALENDMLDRKLALVADRLLDDYLHDEELTIFTSQGADEFYEQACP